MASVLAAAASLAGLSIYVILGSFGLPGELLSVLSAGALAGSVAQLLIVMLVVAVMSIIGDVATYEIARKFSPWVNGRLSRWQAYRRNSRRVRAMLSQSEFSFVFLTRFVFMAFGTVASYVSGLDELDRRVYMTAIAVGDILYAIIYTALGYVFKESWNDVNSLIGNFSTAALLLALVLLLVMWYRRRSAA